MSSTSAADMVVAGILQIVAATTCFEVEMEGALVEHIDTDTAEERREGVGRTELGRGCKEAEEMAELLLQRVGNMVSRPMSFASYSCQTAC